MKIDTTLAVLKVDGKIPWVNDLFIDFESRRDIVFLICSIIFCGKLFVPMPLLVFKSLIIFITSSGEVGDVKKVFGIGLSDSMSSLLVGYILFCSFFPISAKKIVEIFNYVKFDSLPIH